MLLYFCRVVLTVILFFSVSAILFFLMLFGYGRKDRAYAYAQALMPLMLKILGIKVVVQNPENLTKCRPAVFIGNHQHTLDVAVYGSLWPEHSVTLGKKSVGYIPIFGWIFMMSGSILVDRAKHESAMRSMEQAAAELVKKNKSIWVFPEGTRSRGRGLLPFKTGAFHLAIGAKAPIVPLVTSSYFRSINLRRWHAGTVVVRVLEPIPTSSFEDSEASALSVKVRENMKKILDELDSQVPPTV